MIMPSNEFSLNPIRGPARQPECAQLIRLGGDGVAILFGELRKSVGNIDGVFERLHYSARERRWVIQYRVGDEELFTVRISPGQIEAGLALSRSDAERLLQNCKLSGIVRGAIRAGAIDPDHNFVRFPLKDRRSVRSFVNLVKAKKSLVSNGSGGNAGLSSGSLKTM